MDGDRDMSLGQCPVRPHGTFFWAPSPAWPQGSQSSPHLSLSQLPLGVCPTPAPHPVPHCTTTYGILFCGPYAWTAEVTQRAGIWGQGLGCSPSWQHVAQSRG